MANIVMRGQRARFRTAIATAALIGSMNFAAATPVFAAMEEHTQKEGTITIYMATGAVMQGETADKAMLDEITRDATVLDDHTMVVMHNGKLFLVKDHKMSNGKMVSEIVAHMSMH